MADRDERREQARKHLALMKGALAGEAAKTVEAAVIYEDGEGRELQLPEATFEATETKVVTSFAPEALYRDGRGKTVIVDPASFSRPGGAYEDGAFGPEQILCSDSNLYLVLQGMKERYYDANKGFARGQLFTDRAMYLPDVAFSRNGSLKFADVIAVAEPLRERALENHRSEQECNNALDAAAHCRGQRVRDADHGCLRNGAAGLRPRAGDRSDPRLGRRASWRHRPHRVRGSAHVSRRV